MRRESLQFVNHRVHADSEGAGQAGARGVVVGVQPRERMLYLMIHA